MSKLVILLCFVACAFAQQLSILSYNIQSGSGFDQKYNLTRTAAAINAIAPSLDVVTLQEVDNRTRRHAGDDQLQILSTLTNLKYYVLAPFRDGFQGGQYGVGILSKYPILSTKIFRYTQPGGIQNNDCAIPHAKDYCQVCIFIDDN
jgi:endonuclease/exonuclease/phosphatase family metal-dependent hydrolase